MHQSPDLHGVRALNAHPLSEEAVYVSHTKPEAEVEVTETEACGELSDEELYLLDALDEVEQTIDAMSSVLASLRDRLADHLQGRASGPTAVLEDWQDDPEPRLH